MAERGWLGLTWPKQYGGQERTYVEKMILMEGLEYLATNTTFKSVLKFIQNLVDYVAVHKILFLVSISPAAFDDKEIKQLEKNFQQVLR